MSLHWGYLVSLNALIIKQSSVSLLLLLLMRGLTTGVWSGGSVSELLIRMNLVTKMTTAVTTID